MNDLSMCGRCSERLSVCRCMRPAPYLVSDEFLDLDDRMRREWILVVIVGIRDAVEQELTEETT